MITSSRSHTSIVLHARIGPQSAADRISSGKRTRKPWLRAALAGVTMAFALSGCGVFCGGAGGSGAGFAGGCATGMRF